MELVEKIEYSTISLNDGDVLSDCSMSEAEDGELVEERMEISTPSQEESKLELRAKRFGIARNNIRMLFADKVIQRLYRSLGVDDKTRLEALHLFGTDNMKTQDIFAYFENNPPASVEWITDKTCNAVWLDEKSCALALLSSSIRIEGHNVGESANIESSDSSDGEEYVRVEDLRLSLPSGIWRKGHTSQVATNIFIRFATRFDKRSNRRDALMLNSGDYTPSTNVVFPDEGDESIRKLRSESDNPWTDLARQWGNFEKHSVLKSGVRDAREVIKNRELRDSSLKRDAREILNSEKPLPIDKVKKTDKLFGKMHADIEEKKMLQKRSLKRSEWINTDIDLRKKLGNKRIRLSNEMKRPWEKNSEEGLIIEVENVKDRLGEETWIGYESESSEESCELEERSVSSDLRNKLSRNSKSFSPRSPLRIEIDNDIYYSTNASDSGNS